MAVDDETGEVGVALASCVTAGVLGEPDMVLVPAVLVPGRAAGISQGTLDLDAPEAMRNLLEEGVGPVEVVQALTAPDFDDQPELRQYGVVAIPEPGSPFETASHGGDGLGPDTGSAQGAGVAVQGLFLTDSRVADRALDEFIDVRGDGGDLATALAAGLAAGSAAGGDRRCDDQTALFAHLAVATPDDDPLRPAVLLTVTVDEGDGRNPVPMLVEALDEGRRGWIDRGANRAVGIPRVAVLAVGAVLAIAAVTVLRIGMGTPSARR